jgi:hypothetical protein
MALITDLTDEDIVTAWPRATELADEQQPDGDDDATDADDDASDSDDDTSDSDDDTTDS